MSRLNETLGTAKRVTFDDSSKFILLSDCHRGYGDVRDEFKRNGGLFLKTLTDYFDDGFTYIEVGDGDELWKYRQFEKIYKTYSGIFRIMEDYYRENRLYLILGNHDDRKTNPQIMCHKADGTSSKAVPLFDGIEIHEGLVLTHTPTGNEILVVHGHQGDLFCDTLSPVSRIIVNTPVWDILEHLGLDDRISPAKNHEKRRLLVEQYEQWAAGSGYILICGHTHQHHFPKDGAPPYWNTGCWVQKNNITGIVIEKGNLTLMKWDRQFGDPEQVATAPIRR